MERRIETPKAEIVVKLDLRGVSLQPGDVLLVSVPEGHTQEEHAVIHQQIQKMLLDWPERHPGVDVIIVPRTSRGPVQMAALDEATMAKMGWVRKGG